MLYTQSDYIILIQAISARTELRKLLLTEDMDGELSTDINHDKLVLDAIIKKMMREITINIKEQ